MLAEGFEVVGSGIPFVASKAVLRVDGVPLFHAHIAMSLCKDRSGSDGNAARVAFDQRFLLDQDVQLYGIDEQVIGLDRELLKGGGHGLAAGLVNVPGVDALSIDFGDGPSKRVLLDAWSKLSAALGSKFFRIIEADNTALGIENHRGGDDGAEERATPGFIETGDAHPAELSRRSLETGRAEAAHWAEILARQTDTVRLLVSQRDDGIHPHGSACRPIGCQQRDTEEQHRGERQG